MTNETTAPQWLTGQEPTAWAGGLKTQTTQWAVM